MLNKLIIDIINNKVKKEDARLNKSSSDLDQLKQKQSTAFQNKMIQVVYQLSNSFGFNKEFSPLFNQVKSGQIEENIERVPQKPVWFKINKLEFEELTRDIYNNQDNKNFKITINKRTYDLNNAEKLWTEITTRKICKNDEKNCIKN